MTLTLTFGIGKGQMQIYQSDMTSYFDFENEGQDERGEKLELRHSTGNV